LKLLDVVTAQTSTTSEPKVRAIVPDAFYAVKLYVCWHCAQRPTLYYALGC